MSFEKIPSGYPGLDEVLDNIRMGDNVVWQVMDLSEFRLFAQPFAARSISALPGMSPCSSPAKALIS